MFDINTYLGIIRFLGITLGPSYEVVLYEVKESGSKIVAIENGFITNRKIGDPITPYLNEALVNKTYLDDEVFLNYTSKAKSGRLLRSSAYFVLDKHEVKAIINLNFDDYSFVQLADKLIHLVHPDQHLYRKQEIIDQQLAQDTVLSTPLDVIDFVLFEYFKTRSVDLESLDVKTQTKLLSDLAQEDKIEIIGLLNDQNVFLVKGSVSLVAQRLVCSEPTVYRYLAKVKHK